MPRVRAAGRVAGPVFGLVLAALPPTDTAQIAVSALPQANQHSPHYSSN
jgi:hypothetical protein